MEYLIVFLAGVAVGYLGVPYAAKWWNERAGS